MPFQSSVPVRVAEVRLGQVQQDALRHVPHNRSHSPQLSRSNATPSAWRPAADTSGRNDSRASPKPRAGPPREDRSCPEIDFGCWAMTRPGAPASPPAREMATAAESADPSLPGGQADHPDFDTDPGQPAGSTPSGDARRAESAGPGLTRRRDCRAGIATSGKERPHDLSASGHLHAHTVHTHSVAALVFVALFAATITVIAADHARKARRPAEK